MSPLFCTLGHENSGDSRFCRQCGEQLSAVAVGLIALSGQLLGGRYRVKRELGQGGFGRTYLAEDTHRFHEPCVLKEFAPQVQGTQSLQKAEELFAREAGVLYKLQHPQIPQFRELFRAEVQGVGRLFLVQDYVEGQTYHALLQTRRAQGHLFTEPEVRQLLFQLLPVLDYLHRSGVVHRDISPDNLILRSSDGLPVLIDFGGVKQVAAAVASHLHAYASAIGTRLGKLGYAPDEQMNTGDAFPHSDLYALAVTVLVLVTGREPQELLAGDRQQWKQQVRLSPPFVSVLDRMLDPYPPRRYQSAPDVLYVLSSPAQPNHDITLPPPPSPLPTFSHGSSTVAIAPPPARPKARSLPWLPLVLLGLLGGTATGWWWLGRESPSPKPQPTQTAVAPPSDNSTNVSQYSKQEQARKQAIRDRRQTLGIDQGFLVRLVDDAFYLDHPINRALSADPSDEALRADWDRKATEILDRLERLSQAARSRLGSYSNADVDKRRAAVNQLNLSSRSLNDLTDAHFFQWFPDQPRDPTLLQRPFGQVWQAIATDEVAAIQAGTALERIQFPSGRFSQQVSGTLKPGTGRAFTASLQKDQVIRLSVQAPSTTRLSLYPPSSKLPALLEDSKELEWSGKLSASGIYEVVLVSTATQSVEYTINLAAAENVTMPDSTN
ncbi:serine/threonine protein kinase [Leptolyngbya sp. FACHB-36]|uniref:serine/threonine-protein kinase n=1 Tax=Leptolyngbya sp. FACHB-36 TaxID=2692808 RepID=UPI001681C1DD|nr:serine/threonine-protein kinase [Leptolyngbya sp. FACHB-36]MBD2020544.1 serine/threonine protein kinase [Leptolyngbya sp. FACHB-36]